MHVLLHHRDVVARVGLGSLSSTSSICQPCVRNVHMHVCVSEARIKTITGSVDLILDSQHRSLKKREWEGGGEKNKKPSSGWNLYPQSSHKPIVLIIIFSSTDPSFIQCHPSTLHCSPVFPSNALNSESKHVFISSCQASSTAKEMTCGFLFFKWMLFKTEEQPRNSSTASKNKGF